MNGPWRPIEEFEDPYVRAFGAALHAYRLAAFFSQEELAQLTGFSRVYVSMLENGWRRPRSGTIHDLATVLAGEQDAAPIIAHLTAAVGPALAPESRYPRTPARRARKRLRRERYETALREEANEIAQEMVEARQGYQRAREAVVRNRRREQWQDHQVWRAGAG